MGTGQWSLTRMGQWSWLFLCVLLPISGGLVPVPLSIAVILTVPIAVRNSFSIPWRMWWPFLLYYALHVVGMAWTTDLGFGLFDLQIKSGLILLPLAAMIIVSTDKSMVRRSMVAFTVGMCLSMLMGIGKALDCYATDGMMNCFSQSMLSYDLHPSYAAWYGCWCLAYWGHLLIRGSVLERRDRVALVLTLPAILLFTVMLASKSGVIGLLLVLLFLLSAMVYRLRGKQRTLVIVAVLVLFGVAIKSQGALVKARMLAALDAVQLTIDGDEQLYASPEGSALRMVAWTCSLERLVMAPMGAGTGDIKHALMECYSGKGAAEAANRQLNSHSQLLQSAVALGWPGVVTFLLLFWIPLLLSLRARSMPLALFILLFIVNALVESVLEVQAGVVFFSLFVGLLLGERTSQALADEPMETKVP